MPKKTMQNPPRAVRASANALTRSPDLQTLARAIDRERQQLFRAQAIVQSIALLLHQTHDFEQGEPDVAFALNAADDIMEATITKLEPLSLGLHPVIGPDPGNSEP